MSTSWDVRCIDCGEDAGVHASREPIRLYEIQSILQDAHKIALLRGVDSDLTLRLIDVVIPIEFFTKHAGHKLRPVSEYGEVDGTCAKDFTCGHCGSRLGQCDKDIGHSDPCGKRAPT